MSLVPIVRALGGDLYAGGRRALIPGPGHSAHDRSVSLLASDGRLVVHSFGGSTWREVLTALRERGLIDADRRPLGAVAHAWSAPPSPTPADRVAAASRLWSQAAPLTRQLSMTHIRRRGVRRDCPVSAALRHHGAVPSAVYLDRGVRRPALLAAVSSVDGALTAVEVTYLQPGGARAEDLRVSRKVIGVLPPSSAVRLDAPGDALLVGEGVFSTLSASRRFALPAWALLSAGNLRTWRPPAKVRRVLIAADHGAEGERSAQGLQGHLSALGLRVSIAWPPLPALDWNDLEGMKEGEGGSGCAERRDGPAVSAESRP